MHPLIKEVTQNQLKRIPEVKTGYTIRVHQRIKEGEKERTQIFEGLVIKVGHGATFEKTITVRKIISGIGVEKVFPIHSPNIIKIEVKKKAKVRRAKLYYMRERSGKSARLQERHVTDKEREAEEIKMEAMIQEAVSADEKKKKEEVKVAEDIVENSESVEGAEEASKTVETSEESTPIPEGENDDSRNEEGKKEEKALADPELEVPVDKPQSESHDDEGVDPQSNSEEPQQAEKESKDKASE